MKTSNILLLSMIGVILLFITVSLTMIRNDLKGAFNEKETIKTTGVVVGEERDVKQFNKINVSNNIKVRFTQDSSYHVTVNADSALIEIVETQVMEGTLFLRTKKSYDKKERIEIVVSSKQLEAISASSGSEFTTTGKISVPSLTIDAISGANIYINCEVDNIKIDSNSGSKTTLNGQCKKMIVSCDAGSQIIANNMTVQEADINANSGSQVMVYVTELINIEARSGSKIVCKGNPQTGKIDVSGGAQFNKE